MARENVGEVKCLECGAEFYASTICKDCAAVEDMKLGPDAAKVRCGALLGPRALGDVLAERERQDAKWGEQNHDPFTWLTILDKWRWG